MSTKWGYTKGTGPHTWADSFPAAKGLRQSPIDISTNECVNDPDLNQTALTIQYDPSRTQFAANVGYGWKVQIDGEGSVLEGGPLKDKYRLEQFHFHWGRNEKCGSEHTVDGKSYPGEVHLVHWNADKYASFGEAASKEDGLAVLGTFLEIGDEHGELSKLTDILDQIKFKDDKVDIEGGFDPSTLLPAKRDFWTYPGSLTTPPCNESVTWIVFKDSIQISQDQLTKFRQLCSYCGCDECPDDDFQGQILENFRPPLPVGERVVRECAC